MNETANHQQVLANMAISGVGSVSIFFGHGALPPGGGAAEGVNPESGSTVSGSAIDTALAAGNPVTGLNRGTPDPCDSRRLCVGTPAAWRPAQLQAALYAVAGLGLAWQLRLRQGPAFLSAAEPIPYGELALVLLGLLAAVLLLVRRELWRGGVRQLTLERQRVHERFARWLLEHPPQRQVRVHSLGDLQLGICRLSWDGAREWQISVRRQQPPLCRAEAEWTLEVIAAHLSGPGAPTPLVVAGSGGCSFIELPGPHRTRSGPEDAQHLPLHTSDYVQPLLPDQTEPSNAHADDDCSIRNTKG